MFARCGQMANDYPQSQMLLNLRTLFRHKRFTAVASGLLAVGIGFSIALASLADAILFRPLPVPQPQAMARVYTASKLHSMGYVSYPDYQDFARLAKTVSGMIAQTQVLGAVSSGEVTRMRLGLAVSVNYFDVLQVKMQRGRGLQASDALAPVVILSGAFWQTQYHADPSVIGKSVEIRKTAYRVIGIAPPGFGMDRFLHEEFYVPIEAYAARLSEGSPLPDRSRRFLAVYARCHAAPVVVRDELNALAKTLETTWPESNRGYRALVLPEMEARRRENGSLPAVAMVLLGLSALVFLASCASVSGLLLLRMEQRAQEMFLRTALGAPRIGLVFETLVETSVLSLFGLASGLLLAQAALQALQSWVAMPSDVPMAIAGRLDSRMIALAAMAALAASILCGLAPHLSKGTASSTRVTGNSRLGNAVVTGQLALAVVLVGVVINLMVEWRALRDVPLGYRTDHVLLLSFDPAQVGTGETGARQFYRELAARAKNLSGIQRVALAQNIPLGATGAQKQIRLTGADGRDSSIGVWSNIVTPGYFELMHMGLAGGRGFLESDLREGPPVVVINDVLARHWPGGKALGRTIEIGGQRAQVVGVVRTAKYFQINEPRQSFIYLPFSQNYVSHMTLHVETAARPAGSAAALVAIARVIDAVQPVSDIRALDEYLSHGGLFALRMGTALAGIGASVALALAMAGIYASIAESMRKRRREIGIRLALGASPAAIIRLGLTLGGKMSGLASTIGIAFLLLIRIPLGQIIPSQGARTGVLEGFIFCLAAALMVSCAGLAACFVPVSRNALVDPAVALRGQA